MTSRTQNIAPSILRPDALAEALTTARNRLARVSGDEVARVTSRLLPAPLREVLLDSLESWVAEATPENQANHRRAAQALAHCIERGEAHLNLCGLRLSTLPAALWYLTHLERLYISNNPLDLLPSEIDNLRQLTHLIAENTRLRALPESICNLDRLVTLDVSRNWLGHLPSSLNRLRSLEFLYLSGNNLIAPPAALSELPAKCTIVMLDTHGLDPRRERFTFRNQPEGPVVLR